MRHGGRLYHALISSYYDVLYYSRNTSYYIIELLCDLLRVSLCAVNNTIFPPAILGCCHVNCRTVPGAGVQSHGRTVG